MPLPSSRPSREPKPAKRPTSPAGIGVSGVIPARPASGTRTGARNKAAPKAGMLRVACGICGRIEPMAEADFCADCGLLVQ
jgi:hypothetical protein